MTYKKSLQTPSNDQTTMNILAIDPGYERVGIAILDADKKEKNSFVFSDCFRTTTDEPHSQRIAKIQTRMSEVIRQFSPTELAIETLFFNKNQKTALLVAEARGAIIATAQNAGLSVYEYSPQQIKIAVTGSGSSDKNSIIKMIPLLISLNKKITLDDEFDAIACGLTHLSIRKK